MTYKETIEYLFNQMPMFERQGASGYKEGLQNTKELDSHFGHPHNNFRTIHIAGTNGKGSCSHSLASILQVQGYKVGLYTSPHLVDFSERIRVNGKPISEEYIVDFVEQERSFIEPLHPSFFEVTTALAFKYFRDMQVDIAVIEVGLGGRLDCTNIITPILSIITNISYDHTQFLGNTLAKIAGEKAGIIKEGIPIIIGETVPETRPVFEDKAKEVGAPIIFAEDNKEIIDAEPTTDGGIRYSTKSFGDITGSLGGFYQKKNANTVLCAYKKLLGMNVIKADNEEQPIDILKEAFSNITELTGLMGRWQKVNDTPRVICDTGHNVGGWMYLSEQLKSIRCHKMHIVFGMVADKDLDGVLSLLPKDAYYYFTKPDNKRAQQEDVLKEMAAKHGLNGTSYSSVKEAYKSAMSIATDDDFVFVGGSSYVVADFLKSCVRCF